MKKNLVWKFLVMLNILVCMLFLNSKGQTTCLHLDHPINIDSIKQYTKNYNILIHFHPNYAGKQIKLLHNELDCLLKNTENVNFIWGAYKVNRKKIAVFVELNSGATKTFYDIDYLFPSKKVGTTSHICPLPPTCAVSLN